MKKFATSILMLISVSTFAADTFTGTAKLNGKLIHIVVETKGASATKITVDNTVYKISRINDSNIAAGNSSGTVELFLGEEASDQLSKMTKVEIQDYFGISNTKEVNCKKKSKGFVVITKYSNVIGNCIY